MTLSCHDDLLDLSPRLVRLHYFSGRFLTADDLSLEQDYAIRKRSIHDQALHGWGVVCGLEVNASDNGAVIVSAGIAIDPQGREIVVPDVVSLQIDPASTEESPHELDVLLRYAERPTQSEMPEGQPTGIAEGYDLEARPLSTTPPEGVVLGQVRVSTDTRLAVSGKKGRRDAPSVQRLAESIEELSGRIAALESQAHRHTWWSWLRQLFNRSRPASGTTG